jgi:hypothetical protein
VACLVPASSLTRVTTPMLASKSTQYGEDFQWRRPTVSQSNPLHLWAAMPKQIECPSVRNC